MGVDWSMGGNILPGMADIRDKLPFSIAELQRRLNRKSYARLHEIVSGKDTCSAELALQIEEATCGKVSRSDLRPDLWPLHLPLPEVS